MSSTEAITTLSDDSSKLLVDGSPLVVEMPPPRPPIGGDSFDAESDTTTDDESEDEKSISKTERPSSSASARTISRESRTPDGQLPHFVPRLSHHSQQSQHVDPTKNQQVTPDGSTGSLFSRPTPMSAFRSASTSGPLTSATLEWEEASPTNSERIVRRRQLKASELQQLQRALDPQHSSHTSSVVSVPRLLTRDSPPMNDLGMMAPTRNVQVGSLIGQGGHAKVFLGLNYDTGELMAVKMIEFRGHDDIDQQLAKIDSLRTEIDMMKDLRHPNVVRYLFSATDVVEGAPVAKLFMEYVPGGSLCKVIDDFGALPEITVSNYTSQLIDAIEYVHGRGIAHMDVKTANVLLNAGGTVKLADFGTALLVQGARAGKHTQSSKEEKEIDPAALSNPRGTPLFMAPEVTRHDPNSVAPAADIWSLGCLVMEMLTGRQPWAHLGDESVFKTMNRIASSEAPLELPAGLTEEASSFLRLCLQPKPADRATAESLRGHIFLDRIGSVVTHRDVGSVALSEGYLHSFAESPGSFTTRPPTV